MNKRQIYRQLAVLTLKLAKLKGHPGIVAGVGDRVMVDIMRRHDNPEVIDTTEIADIAIVRGDLENAGYRH